MLNYMDLRPPPFSLARRPWSVDALLSIGRLRSSELAGSPYVTFERREIITFSTHNYFLSQLVTLTKTKASLI